MVVGTHGRTFIVLLVISSEIFAMRIETLVAKKWIEGMGVSFEGEGASRGSF